MSIVKSAIKTKLAWHWIVFVYNDLWHNHCQEHCFKDFCNPCAIVWLPGIHCRRDPAGSDTIGFNSCKLKTAVLLGHIRIYRQRISNENLSTRLKPQAVPSHTQIRVKHILRHNILTRTDWKSLCCVHCTDEHRLIRFNVSAPENKTYYWIFPQSITGSIFSHFPKFT